MKIAAIIPVKSFAISKSRLSLTNQQKQELCKLMLEQVIQTVHNSHVIDKIILVSKDDAALDIGRRFNATCLHDDDSGVNNAVSIAGESIMPEKFDASIVLPQDIPLIQTEDVENLLKFLKYSDSVLIVPSRRFDGTNALVRMPTNLIKTHYDEDSYKIHLDTGKFQNARTSLALIRRIMIDIDNNEDLEFLLKQRGQPAICEKIKKICTS